MRNQIRMWRRPQVVVCETSGDGRLNEEWRCLFTHVRLALNVNKWSDFEHTCVSVREAMCPDRRERAYAPFGEPTRTLAEQLEHHMEFPGIVTEESVVLTGEEGVGLEICKIDSHWREAKMRMRMTFEDPARGQQVVAALKKEPQREFYVATMRYEQALFLSAHVFDHFVFARGSQERLGERVHDVGKEVGFRRHPVWCVRPLKGEELKVYGGDSVARRFDLYPDDAAPGSYPADHNVVASIGNLHLAFRKGVHERGSRKRPHDRIVVFRDANLPMEEPWSALPEDDDGWDDEPDRYGSWSGHSWD